VRANFVGRPVRAQLKLTAHAGQTVTQTVSLPSRKPRSVFNFVLRDQSSGIRFGVEPGEERVVCDGEVLEVAVTFRPRWVGK
jgi:hypothetical protein